MHYRAKSDSQFYTLCLAHNTRCPATCPWILLDLVEPASLVVEERIRSIVLKRQARKSAISQLEALGPHLCSGSCLLSSEQAHLCLISRNFLEGGVLFNNNYHKTKPLNIQCTG
jgi:hypothetical protein